MIKKDRGIRKESKKSSRAISKNCVEDETIESWSLIREKNCKPEKLRRICVKFFWEKSPSAKPGKKPSLKYEPIENE